MVEQRSPKPSDERSNRSSRAKKKLNDEIIVLIELGFSHALENNLIINAVEDGTATWERQVFVNKTVSKIDIGEGRFHSWGGRCYCIDLRFSHQDTEDFITIKRGEDEPTEWPVARITKIKFGTL